MERTEAGARDVYFRLIPLGNAKLIVMDDESYFSTDPSHVVGAKYYHTSNKQKVERKLTVKGKEKFSP